MVESALKQGVKKAVRVHQHTLKNRLNDKTCTSIATENF